MSWRTHGFYKGLSKSARAWLKAFDRKWDTKAEGRVRDDAFEKMADKAGPNTIRPKTRLRLVDLAAPEAQDPAEPADDGASLALLAREVARFTVPRMTRTGWSIHLTLKSGEKVRVHFENEDAAVEAYETLCKASSMLSAA